MSHKSSACNHHVGMPKAGRESGGTHTLTDAAAADDAHARRPLGVSAVEPHKEVSSPAPSPMASAIMGTARAIYDYEARASDELSFKRHDIIQVLGQDEEDEGWYRGALGDKEGLFPNNYVQFQEKEKPAEPEPPKPKPAAPAAAAASAPPKPAGPSVPEYVKQDVFEKTYSLAETLGRGRFSQVRRCTQVPGGRSCAVKIMDLDDPELGSSAADAEREVIAEVEVLRAVQHVGVVQLFETFKNTKHYYLVLEDLGGGDLFDRIEQNGPFKEADAGPLLKQVVSAVSFLHDKGIVHRDIKPDNLVFDAQNADAQIKLIDFGYAGHCAHPTDARAPGATVRASPRLTRAPSLARLASQVQQRNRSKGCAELPIMQLQRS